MDFQDRPLDISDTDDTVFDGDSHLSVLLTVLVLVFLLEVLKTKVYFKVSIGLVGLFLCLCVCLFKLRSLPCLDLLVYIR